MVKYPRFFVPPSGNYFLFETRGTGKSTWLAEHYSGATWVDLPDPATQREYLAGPGRLRDLLCRLDDFSRFLEAISFSHAQILNVAAVARDCLATRNTVESYVTILEDLLLASRLPVFPRRAKRETVAQGKSYFFDCGVSRSLRPAGPIEVKNTRSIRPQDLRGLRAFQEDYPQSSAVLLYRGRETLERSGVLAMPVESFLEQLHPEAPLPAL